MKLKTAMTKAASFAGKKSLVAIVPGAEGRPTWVLGEHAGTVAGFRVDLPEGAEPLPSAVLPGGKVAEAAKAMDDPFSIYEDPEDAGRLVFACPGVAQRVPRVLDRTIRMPRLKGIRYRHLSESDVEGLMLAVASLESGKGRDGLEYLRFGPGPVQAVNLAVKTQVRLDLPEGGFLHHSVFRQWPKGKGVAVGFSDGHVVFRMPDHFRAVEPKAKNVWPGPETVFPDEKPRVTFHLPRVGLLKAVEGATKATDGVVIEVALESSGVFVRGGGFERYVEAGETDFLPADQHVRLDGERLARLLKSAVQDPEIGFAGSERPLSIWGEGWGATVAPVLKVETEIVGG